MKNTIQHLLSRQPTLYRLVLSAIRSPNDEKKTFLKLVKDGDVVFDVGANFGTHTVLFSHIAGSRGHVHAFEPVPPTFASLSRRLLHEKRFDNVTLNNLALGEVAGTFKIHVPAGDFGQASLKTHSIASWSRSGQESFECEVMTLDSYATQSKIDRIDLMKVDVEGAELPALKGARNTLERLHPTIHFEYLRAWTEAFGYNGSDLVRFLQSCGYRYFYDAELRPLACPTEDIERDTSSQNIVCTFKPLKG
ncbi:MAG TPA: FkbM family methyltransferase [Roseimicrobium sp.]|nr:FkbM family methyltransferase [Roseimicrobium sp.]